MGLWDYLAPRQIGRGGRKIGRGEREEEGGRLIFGSWGKWKYNSRQQEETEKKQDFVGQRGTSMEKTDDEENVI